MLNPVIGLSFGAPAMLWGLTLVGVPILIFLWNRRRFQVHPWAAMEFLLRAMRKNRRRLQLENLLLLLLRILIITFIVLAFSQPSLEDSTLLSEAAAAREQRNVMILMDTSYSMAFKETDRSYLEEAAEVLKGFLETRVQEGDRINLGFADWQTRFHFQDGPQIVTASIRDSLNGALGQVQTGFRQLAPRQALEACQEMAKRYRIGAGATAVQPIQLFIFTDLQRASWLSASGRLEDPDVRPVLRELQQQDVEVRFVQVGNRPAENAAIVDLRVELPEDRPVATTWSPFQVVVTLKSFASEPLRNLKVGVLVDGELKGDRGLESKPLLAEEERPLTFEIKIDTPGSHIIEARLEGDGLDQDNHRWHAITVREGVRVLLVDGAPGDGKWDGESPILARHLVPGFDADNQGEQRDPIFSLRVIDDLELERIVSGESLDTGLHLESFDAIVLAGVGTLRTKLDDRQPPPEDGTPPLPVLVRKLQEYVKSGGALWIGLGRRVQPEFYNEYLHRGGMGLLPVKLDIEPIGEEAPVEYQNPGLVRYALHEPEGEFEHPAMALFNHKDNRDLVARDEDHAPRFYKYFKVTPDPDATVILSLVNGGERHPVLVEEEHGLGRVTLFASSFGLRWNNWTRKFLGMALSRRLLLHLVQRSGAPRDVGLEDPLERVLTEAEHRVVKLQVPAGGEEWPEPDKALLELTLRKLEEDNRFRLNYEGTEVPGPYQLQFLVPGKLDVEWVEYFAVNLDPLEGDLRRTSAEALGEALGADEERPVRFVLLEDLVRSEVSGDDDENHLWWYLVIAVMAWMGLETALASLFQRRSGLAA